MDGSVAVRRQTGTAHVRWPGRASGGTIVLPGSGGVCGDGTQNLVGRRFVAFGRQSLSVSTAMGSSSRRCII